MALYPGTWKTGKILTPGKNNFFIAINMSGQHRIRSLMGDDAPTPGMFFRS
jgi:hypothetical protein